MKRVCVPLRFASSLSSWRWQYFGLVTDFDDVTTWRVWSRVSQCNLRTVTIHDTIISHYHFTIIHDVYAACVVRSKVVHGGLKSRDGQTIDNKSTTGRRLWARNSESSRFVYNIIKVHCETFVEFHAGEWKLSF